MNIDRNLLAIVIVGLAAVFFLQGAEDTFRKADEATKADKVRIICASPGQHLLPCRKPTVTTAR